LLIVNGYENDADSGPYTPRCYVLDDGAQPQLVRIDCLVSTTADNAPSPTPAASILSAAPTPVTEPSPPEPADAVVTSPSIEPPTQTATETTSQSSSINPIWIIVGVAAALYFLPSLIASQKGRFLATFVANLAFGWTLLGWIIVLIWALMPSSKPRVMVIENDGTLRPKGRAGR